MNNGPSKVKVEHVFFQYSKVGASQSDSFSIIFEIFMYYVNICKRKTSEKRRTEYSIAGTFPHCIDLDELFVNQGKVITVEIQWLEN